MLRDKIIVKALEGQGIRGVDFYRFKLKNPNTYDRLDGQADISPEVAILAYAKILRGRT